MSGGQVIRLLNWERHQHYKDRDPPWIKLYRDLLSSESWVLGTDESRLVQVASTLLAARYQNATPLNFALFRKVASLDLTEREFNAAVAHLVSTKFLEIEGDTETGKHDASKPLAKCSSEAIQSNTEAEGDKVPNGTLSSSGNSTDPVVSVFDHWRKVHDHPRSKLDPKRRKTIKRALETYSPDLLCESISGYLRSQFHMGQNDRNAVFDDVEMMLRDSKHIDAGLAFARNQAPNVSALTRRNISAVEDWQPPEVRHAAI